MAKPKRERRYDRYGPIDKMVECAGYVMIRRPHRKVFVITAREWVSLSVAPVVKSNRDAAILHAGRVL